MTVKSGTAGAGEARHAGEGPAGKRAAARDLSPRYKWIALSNTTLGVLMATINQSIVLIALPNIFHGIGVDPLAASNTSYLLWMFMGFLVVSAVLVVSFGRLGDMFGRVRMYNMGFAVFTAASILLAITWFGGPRAALWLIIWRIVQGIGGAFLFANSTAILTDAFPANQRGTALGMNSIAAIAGSFIGLLLGGVLGPVNWHFVFLVSVPFGIFGTFWAYFMLRDLSERRPARMDWWGNVGFGAGLVAILIGITYGLMPYGGHPMGWTSPFVLSMIGGGIAALVAFLLVETKVAEPMLKLSLFRIRAFAAGNLANLLMGLGRGGMQFTLIIWLQGIWLPLHGYSFAQTPLWAGIYMIPLTIGFLASAPLSGWLSDRFGARAFTVGGALLTAVSFVLLMILPVNFTYWVFALILALNGFSSGLFVSPNRAEIMNAVPANQRGAAGGTIATFMNTAFVLSIGIFFTLIVTGLSRTLPAALSGGLISQGVPAGAAQTISHLPPIGVLFAAFLGYNPMKQLLGPLLGHLPASHAAYLTGRDFFPHVITHPFHSGIGIAFWFAIAANVIAAACSLLTGRGATAAMRAAGPATAGTGPAARGTAPAASAAVPSATRTEPAFPGMTLAGPAGPGPGAAALVADRAAPAGGRGGAGLAGLVRDRAGRPVGGAVVTVTAGSGRQVAREVTGPDGRYRLADVGTAPVTVIVTAHGYEPAAATVVAQPGTVAGKEIVLAGRAGLTGTVRSAGAGTPLAGAQVVVSDTAGNVVASAVTGADGSFLVDGLPADGGAAARYAVTATAPGHRPASRDVTVDGQVVTAHLGLPVAGEAHGTVRAPDGSPVPGVLVTAASTGGDLVASAVTGEDGRYRLAGLGGGQHVLVAAGHQPASAAVSVDAGATAVVTLRIGPAASAGAGAPADGSRRDGSPGAAALPGSEPGPCPGVSRGPARE
jgi:MFS family permease